MKLRSGLRAAPSRLRRPGFRQGAGAPVTPPPPSVPVSALLADGWSATYPNPPASFSPETSPVTFSVIRQGYDTNAQPVTVTDTLTVMERVRVPGTETLSADRVALSDYVYATDQVVGLTNPSTRAAPLPIALWTTPDRLICKANTFQPGLVVAHGHARGGKPVAAVKFIATDGAAVQERMVSELTPVTYAASGLTVPEYRPTFDMTAFAQGATVTYGAVIYPWVGAPFRIWDTAVAAGSPGGNDADAYPSPNLCARKVLCDRTGAYGTAYAYVSPTGTDTSNVARTDPVAARAAPFATWLAAAAAIKTFSNANFGRNSADGGIVRFEEGAFALSASMQTSASTAFWPITFEAADPTKAATTILTDRGTTLASGAPANMVFRNLTFRRSVTGSITFLDQSAAAQTYATTMVVESCIFDAAGFGAYGAWFTRNSRLRFINCSGGDCGQAGIVSTINKSTVSIGCGGAFLNGQTNFSAVGCKGTLPGGNVGIEMARPATASRVAQVGGFFGWNFITHNAPTSRTFGNGAPVGPRGAAMVGNIIEQTGSSSSPACQINADSDLQPVENIVRQMNTVVGQRTNHFYNDTGNTPIAKSGYELGNIDFERNVKSDLFPGTDTAAISANRTGNWPILYRVAQHHNMAFAGDSKGSGAPGFNVWTGEIAGLGEVQGSQSARLNPAFVNDQARAHGGGAGNGDYTPGPGTQIPYLPADRAPYPVDQKGRAIRNDGTGRVGALQMAA